MGAVLSFALFFLGIREQLAAVQAEVAGLQWASKDLAKRLVEAARG